MDKYRDIIKKIKRFDNSNIKDYNFFVILKTDNNSTDIINQLRSKFNDLIKIKQTEFFDSHITLIFGIKFDNVSNLTNYLLHIKKVSQNIDSFAFNNLHVKMFKDPKTIVITPDKKSNEKIKELRLFLLKRADLFSDVLSFPYMTYIYNRYHKYEDSNFDFKPHIGLLYFFHYKEIYESQSKSEFDYVFDFAQEHIQSNLEKLEIKSISVVCSNVDDNKWKDVVDFELR